MPPIVADASALQAAVENGWETLLPALFDRIFLPPSVVEALVERGTIEPLAEAAEPLIEVVSLTQADAALAAQLLVEMGGAGASPDPAAHRPAADALALMARADLGATHLLTDNEAARRVAEGRGILTLDLAGLVAGPRAEREGERDGPAEPSQPLMVELDNETQGLIAALLKRGIGEDEGDVVRRAVRGLAAALLSSANARE